MATTLRSLVEERFPRLAQWLSGAQPSLDENAVRELIERDETEAIEFKERLLPHDRIAEYAVGIGNSGGGLLLFGVTDKKPRKLAGIPLLTEADLQKLQTSVYNSTGIRVRLELVHTQAGQFLIGLRIPSRPHGHIFCTQTGKYLTK